MTDSKKVDSGHFSSAYGLKTRDETIKHYASWAKSYDREVADDNGYVQPQRVAAALLQYNADRSIKILDAGCGSGLSGVALQTAEYQNIDGCDFSPEMLDQAAKKSAYKLLFECDLNQTIPTPDGAYDCVVCVGVFSFAHVSPTACDELLRVLKSGGHLIIALNEQFWERGGLEAKISDLVAAKHVEVLEKVYGDHLPGHGVNGWVLVMQKL